jgi:hypothetical protein
MAEKWSGRDPERPVPVGPERLEGDLPEPETYVAVDLAVLAAVKALAGLHEHNPTALLAVRLVLRVARVDEVSGRLVVGVRLTRDLEPPDDSGHFGTV